MHLINQADIEQYISGDPIRALSAALMREGDHVLTCQRWLDESAPKRFIFERLYGDLLRSERPLRVLDVGGGLSVLSRELARRHAYVLVDFLCHDNDQTLAPILNEVGRQNVHAKDWYDYRPEGVYDVVIANDLFPNVDQRLELFLSQFLPITREVRLSLTYYNTPRYYFSRRIDGDEVFCMLAWDGKLTRLCLQPLADRIRDPCLDLLEAENPSVYPNGRQVCLVTLKGEVR